MGRPRKYPLTEKQISELSNSANPLQIEIPNTKFNEADPSVETPVIATINTLENSISLSQENHSDAPIVVELVKKNIPPIIRKRNEYGFLENVDYVFKEDGKVDWRKMIKPEYLVFNKERKSEIEKKYGKTLDELSVTEVEDKYLLILLFGIRNLATLRGFYTVSPNVKFCSDFKATVETNIGWIPNNDTEMRGEYFGDVASATAENTNGFGRLFLESIAANRAFVRAVRNYLEINIVGFDEVKNDKVEMPADTNPVSVHSILERTAKDLGLSFEQFKNGVKEKYSSSIESDYTKWDNFRSLSPGDAYKMLNILKKAQESKK